MKKSWKKKIIFIFILAVFFIVAASTWYVRDYYHSEESVQEYLEKDGEVKITKIDAGLFLDGMGEDTAFVFYPGAKVEYTAYVPLLYQLADQGIDCFLIKMPFNLAIFGQNKAEAIMELYDYRYWYLSGHSLGGAMAAANASEHLEKWNGLILLAAYPTKDLKKEGFSVASIYGSEDYVLNKNKVIQGRKFMPSDYTEISIEGGNHAFFGNYGEQKGDGIAVISRKEQQKQTVEAIVQLIEEQKEGKEKKYENYKS